MPHSESRLRNSFGGQFLFVLGLCLIFGLITGAGNQPESLTSPAAWRIWYRQQAPVSNFIWVGLIVSVCGLYVAVQDSLRSDVPSRSRSSRKAARQIRSADAGVETSVTFTFPDAEGFPDAGQFEFNRVGDVPAPAPDSQPAFARVEPLVQAGSAAESDDDPPPVDPLQRIAELMKRAQSRGAQTEFGRASELCRQAHDQCEALIADSPYNLNWLQLSASILAQRATFLKQDGQTETALQVTLSERDVRQQLRLSTFDLDRDFALCLDRLSKLKESMGDLAASRAAAYHSLEVTRGILKSSVDDTNKQRDLSISLERCGDLEQAQGNVRMAVDLYSESLKIAEWLCQTQPSSAELISERDWTRSRLAELKGAKLLALFSQAD